MCNILSQKYPIIDNTTVFHLFHIIINNTLKINVEIILAKCYNKMQNKEK